jgi:hypothetical protein
VVRGKYIIAFLWGYDEGCCWLIGNHLDYFVVRESRMLSI